MKIKEFFDKNDLIKFAPCHIGAKFYTDDIFRVVSVDEDPRTEEETIRVASVTTASPSYKTFKTTLSFVEVTDDELENWKKNTNMPTLKEKYVGAEINFKNLFVTQSEMNGLYHIFDKTDGNRSLCRSRMMVSINPDLCSPVEGNEVWKKGQDCKTCFKKAKLKIEV